MMSFTFINVVLLCIVKLDVALHRVAYLLLLCVLVLACACACCVLAAQLYPFLFV